MFIVLGLARPDTSCRAWAVNMARQVIHPVWILKSGLKQPVNSTPLQPIYEELGSPDCSAPLPTPNLIYLYRSKSQDEQWNGRPLAGFSWSVRPPPPSFLSCLLLQCLVLPPGVRPRAAGLFIGIEYCSRVRDSVWDVPYRIVTARTEVGLVE